MPSSGHNILLSCFFSQYNIYTKQLKLIIISNCQTKLISFKQNLIRKKILLKTFFREISH